MDHPPWLDPPAAGRSPDDLTLLSDPTASQIFSELDEDRPYTAPAEPSDVTAHIRALGGTPLDLTPGRTYPCHVAEVVDGDTLYLDIDLGFGTRHVATVRLRGIDTGNPRSSSGHMAALFTTRWVEEFADRLMVTVYKVRHKAGRYVADIHTPSGSDLARDLLEVRLAVAL